MILLVLTHVSSRTIQNQVFFNKGLSKVCLRCAVLFVAPMSARILDLIATWAERAYWVDIVHAALKGDADGQAAVAAKMEALFPHVDKASMSAVTYAEALRHCKNSYLNVPHKSMSPSLVQFLDLKLNYLTPGVLLGIGCSVAFVVNCGHVALLIMVSYGVD